MNAKIIFSLRLSDCVMLSEYNKEMVKKNVVFIFPFLFIIFLLL